MHVTQTPNCVCRGKMLNVTSGDFGFFISTIFESWFKNGKLCIFIWFTLPQRLRCISPSTSCDWSSSQLYVTFSELFLNPSCLPKEYQEAANSESNKWAGLMDPLLCNLVQIFIRLVVIWVYSDKASLFPHKWWLSTSFGVRAELSHLGQVI